MNIKYKLGEVAKDLNKPNKEVIELLSKYTGEPRKSVSVLSEDELNYVSITPRKTSSKTSMIISMPPARLLSPSRKKRLHRPRKSLPEIRNPQRSMQPLNPLLPRKRKKKRRRNLQRSSWKNR